MQFQVILAHGALGWFDELIFLGIAAIFLTIMGISWVKSRNTRPSFEQKNEVEQRDFSQEAAEPERFRLD